MKQQADKPKAITAADIRVAMLKTFASPEWAVMWEVSNATGGGSARYADAVMMSLWPSRGLELHGVEIKTSRQDWKREAADPTKAEKIAAYCDRWWVHVAPNVIQDLCEVPVTWGVREWNGAKWRTVREAAKTEALPMDRRFLAALLRRAENMHYRSIADEVRAQVEKKEALIETRISEQVTRITREAGRAAEQVKAFEDATGLSLGGSWYGNDAAEIGKIVKLAQSIGAESMYSGLRGAVQSAQRASEIMTKALADYDALQAQGKGEAA